MEIFIVSAYKLFLKQFLTLHECSRDDLEVASENENEGGNGPVYSTHATAPGVGRGKMGMNLTSTTLWVDLKACLGTDGTSPLGTPEWSYHLSGKGFFTNDAKQGTSFFLSAAFGG